MDGSEVANTPALTEDDSSVAHVGKYRIIAKLGSGGMSEVFLAVAHGPVGFNKLVVIKRLLPNLAQETLVRGMFLDEARLAARLNHPNVVHTFEVIEDKDHLFLAMEYLEGQSLRVVQTELKKLGQQLHPIESAAIISEMLAGLHYAHELKDYDGTPLGLVHRDISPQNIFLTYDGTVKLVDFGIAKVAHRDTHTDAGVIKGKAAYMSPEQAIGLEIDRRSDIFSAGVVLWEMLTGARLLEGATTTASLIKLINLNVPPPSSIKPDLDLHLEMISTTALGRNPELRFQTAKQMRDALEDVIRGSGRRVDADRVAEILAAPFAEIRKRRQDVIQAAMRGATAGADSWDAAIEVISLSSLGSDSGVSGVQSTSGSDDTCPHDQANARAIEPASISRIGITAAMSGRNARWKIAAGAVAAACVAALVVVLLARRTHNVRPEVVLPPSSVAQSQPSDAASTALTAAIDSVMPIGATPTEIASAGAKTVTSIHTFGNPPGTKAKDERSVDSGASVASSDAAAPGYLTIDSSPWARVNLNGRPVGITPVARIPLAPGTYSIELVNDEKGLRSSVSVSIESGKATSRRVILQ